MRPFRALAALALIAVLPGCGSLGGPDIPVQVYSPVVKVQPDAAWPTKAGASGTCTEPSSAKSWVKASTSPRSAWRA